MDQPESLPGRRAPQPRHALAGALDDLLGPDLPGRPACTGTAPLFDLQVDREPQDLRDARHEQAKALCRTCSVIDACAAALSREHRPTGVWAGQLQDPSARGT